MPVGFWGAGCVVGDDVPVTDLLMRDMGHIGNRRMAERPQAATVGRRPKGPLWSDVRVQTYKTRSSWEGCARQTTANMWAFERGGIAACLRNRKSRAAESMPAA